MSINNQLETPDSTALLEKQVSLLRSDHLASYIDFTPTMGITRGCRRAVENFGKVVCDMFPDAVKRWDPVTQLEEVKENEITHIREAKTFNQNATTLFHFLTDCITCGDEHVARLHLSGFRTRELEMLRVVDQHNWNSACFSP